jgi:hypothetical protein
MAFDQRQWFATEIIGCPLVINYEYGIRTVRARSLIFILFKNSFQMLNGEVLLARKGPHLLLASAAC